MVSYKRAARAAAVGFLLSIATHAASAGAVWFSDSKNLYRLDTSSQQTALAIKADDALALEVNADGSVWVLSKKRLTKYSLNGVVATDIELKALSLKSVDHVALDSRDGSLWVAEGKNENEDDDGDGNAKRVVRLDPVGQRVQDFVSPGRIRAMVLGLDQSLWLLGNKTLWHYSRAGVRLSSLELKPITQHKSTLLALDAPGVWLWMGAEKQLIRVDGNTPAVAPIKLDLEKKVELLTVDPRTGDLWVATEQTLNHYSDSATLTKSIDLKSLGLKNPKSLVFDAANWALWLGHDKGITRFAADGSKLATITSKDNVESIGVAPFSLVPTIDIVAPMPDQVTNDPKPLLKIRMGALCNAQPCNFSTDFFDSYRLAAKLDGGEIGSLFTRVPSSTERTHRPLSPLSEGAHTFMAQAIDSFGQVSTLREARIIIDTTPPRFNGLSPADGSLFKAPAITLLGTLDETAGIRVDGPGTSLSANGTSFSFPVMLNEGTNNFVLRATDAAGNRAEKALAYLLDSVAPVFQDIIPSDGVVTNLTSIAITGRLSEEATLTLGPDLLPLATGHTFTKMVPLVEGTNVFVLKATDTAGNTASRTINITRDTVAPKLLNLTPANGAAVNEAQVRFNGAFDDAHSVTLTGNGRTQMTSGTTFGFDVMLQAGANTFVLRGVDRAGNAAEENVTLTWAAYDPIDAPVMAVWDSMNDALKLGDVTKALAYLTTGAQEKYRPVFEALLVDMPAIIASYSKPSRGLVSDDMAEYAIMRFIEAEGDTQVFFIYFVKSTDGRWLIETM